jgi:hypothetical protein
MLKPYNVGWTYTESPGGSFFSRAVLGDAEAKALRRALQAIEDDHGLVTDSFVVPDEPIQQHAYELAEEIVAALDPDDDDGVASLVRGVFGLNLVD